MSAIELEQDGRRARWVLWTLASVCLLSMATAAWALGRASGLASEGDRLPERLARFGVELGRSSDGAPSVTLAGADGTRSVLISPTGMTFYDEQNRVQISIESGTLGSLINLKLHGPSRREEIASLHLGVDQNGFSTASSHHKGAPSSGFYLESLRGGGASLSLWGKGGSVEEVAVGVDSKGLSGIRTKAGATLEHWPVD